MDIVSKINELKKIKSAEPTKAYVRLQKLFDEASFVELEGFTKGANVVTGYGSVNGKLCFAYAQEGAVNRKHAQKIANLYEKAINMGAPVVAVLDSEGVVLEDGQQALEAYGILLKNVTKASGVIPQIAVVLGDCLGMAAYVPTLSDFVIMKSTDAKMFLSSPAALKGAEDAELLYSSFSSGEFHSEKSGLVHESYKTEEECLQAAYKLVDLMPLNNIDFAAEDNGADINRESEELNTAAIDPAYIISTIADDFGGFEIQPEFGKEIITTLIKVNGVTVGAVANRGGLSTDGAKKAAKFVKMCDAFNIPIVTITDAEGYKKVNVDKQQELMMSCTALLSAFAEATVAKVNVIVNKGIGSAYMLMNSKFIGADVTLAWPNAEISLLNKQGSVNVMKQYTEEEYEEASSPYTSAELGYIDDVIIPAATRKHVIASLEMLYSKRVQTVAKKHNSI